MLERVRERGKMKHISDNLYAYIPEIIMQADIYDNDPSLTYDQIVGAVAKVNPRKSARDVYKGLQWLVKNDPGIIKTSRNGVEVYSFDSDTYEYGN